MTNEPYTMQSPFLVVEIACALPGPQLGSDEKTALNRLYEHAEKVGELLFAGHDPDGYQMWLDSQEGPTRSWDDLIRHPAPAHSNNVVALRPDIEVEGKDPVIFGRNLKILREEQHLSRMQLKVLAGLGNFMYLAEIEGGNKYPNAPTIEKLAKAFEMSVTDFVDRCSQPPGWHNRSDGGDR